MAIVSNAVLDIGVRVYLFELVFLFPLGKKYPEVELLDHVVVLFSVLGDAVYCCPPWLHLYTFSPTVHTGSLVPFMAVIPIDMRGYLVVGFHLHFPDG